VKGSQSGRLGVHHRCEEESPGRMGVNQGYWGGHHGCEEEPPDKGGQNVMAVTSNTLKVTAVQSNALKVMHYF